MTAVCEQPSVTDISRTVKHGLSISIITNRPAGVNKLIELLGLYEIRFCSSNSKSTDSTNPFRSALFANALATALSRGSRNTWSLRLSWGVGTKRTLPQLIADKIFITEGNLCYVSNLYLFHSA